MTKKTQHPAYVEFISDEMNKIMHYIDDMYPDVDKAASAINGLFVAIQMHMLSRGWSDDMLNQKWCETLAAVVSRQNTPTKH